MRANSNCPMFSVQWLNLVGIKNVLKLSKLFSGEGSCELVMRSNCEHRLGRLLMRKGDVVRLRLRGRKSQVCQLLTALPGATPFPSPLHNCAFWAFRRRAGQQLIATVCLLFISSTRGLNQLELPPPTPPPPPIRHHHPSGISRPSVPNPEPHHRKPHRSSSPTASGWAFDHSPESPTRSRWTGHARDAANSTEGFRPRTLLCCDRPTAPIAVGLSPTANFRPLRR